MDGMGKTAANFLKKFDISFESLDKFAECSKQKAAAQRSGHLAKEILTVEVQ